MICAFCGERLKVDGPFGFLHPSSASMYGRDGHLVLPISWGAYRAAAGASDPR